ncbi:MAG TPA: peptide chain release factor N(5)-glutamine methyltransferase [Chitinophagaceae bacterium]|nr:peptide chain release factor N(5)-glutamine methyltransferase [Chitinophagaceae bacterium]
MTLTEARTVLTKELKTIYNNDELKNIVDLVLEHITSMSRSEQVKSKLAYLTCTQLETIDSITERLRSNEPVQYVLGEAWFGGMKFKVNKNVLIPRPETEELVDWVIEESQKSNPDSYRDKSQKILDVGTGSGCIPITLKKKLPDAVISAIEVCSEALFVATENAIEHNADVDFVVLDFLDEEKWQALGQFDIIVSNPPYVKQSETPTMHERVLNFEPRLALFVPDNDALLFYRKLSDFSLKHLEPGGRLFVEINEALGEMVANLFRSAGFVNVELKKDMQGKDRMVMALP